MTTLADRVRGTNGQPSTRGQANPAGMLGFRIEHADGLVTRVILQSSRPTQAADVLVGRRPEEAITLVPLLFSLCGGAQSVAAKRAFRIACQQPADPLTLLREALALRIERIRDHSLRLLLDWPGVLGMSPNHEAAAKLMTAYRAAERAIDRATPALPQVPSDFRALAEGIRQDILDGSLITFLSEEPASAHTIHAHTSGTTWLEKLLRRLIELGWAGVGAGSGIAAIETDTACDWQETLRDAGFVDRPTLAGIPRDNTAFARRRQDTTVAHAVAHWGDGLAARLIALASELDADLIALHDEVLGDQSLSNEPTQGTCVGMEMGNGKGRNRDPGRGIASVEAGRGRLIHDVTVEDGRVRSYRVIAPTEWNFHPEGLAARMLARTPFEDADAGASMARAVICAVDPCVGYHLDISAHA